MNRDAIWHVIQLERARQAAKWSGKHLWGEGDCSSPSLPNTVKMAVLTEEVGEVSRAMLDKKTDDLRQELIQVAAVAVAWLESL